MLEILCNEVHMKYFQLKCMHAWFPGETYKCQQKCDLIRYNVAKSLHNQRNESLVQKTIIINLNQTADEIFAGFSRQHRQAVKKSEYDGLETVYHDSESIIANKDLLDEFARFYKLSYQNKGMNRNLDINILNDYINHLSLWITSISLDGKPLVFHSLISDHKIVRALHSCSLFRTEEQSMQQIIGRANKKLHWDEMQFFKNLGMGIYDLGGVFSFDSKDGIDQFKLGFGGEHWEFYKEIEVCSAKAKLCAVLVKRMNKSIL